MRQPQAITAFPGRPLTCLRLDGNNLRRTEGPARRRMRHAARLPRRATAYYSAIIAMAAETQTATPESSDAHYNGNAVVTLHQKTIS